MAPRRPLRPSALVGVAGLAAAASAALLLPASGAGQSAAPTATLNVVRANVSLPVARKTLGQFRELKLRRGSTIDFHEDSRGPLLEFADTGRGGYVTVSTGIAPQTAVGVNANVNLVRQRLRLGKTRAILMVESASGRSVQAGVIKVRDGSYHWAVWQKTAKDARVSVIVSKRRATLRAWHRVQLVTRWGTAAGRVVLRVDGDRVAAGKLSLRRAMANRVTIGLGRPSSRGETGVLRVRSAGFRTAVGAGGASGGGASGGGAGRTTPPAPAPGPISTLPGRELMRADWETGNTSQWDSVQTVNSQRIQAVRSPVRQGNFAGRFEVRPGEDPFCGSGGCFGPRAEVSLDTNESEGQERWYEWSTLVDESVPATNAFQVISQWHSRADGRPPVAWFVEGNNLLLMVHPHRAPGDQISFIRAWQGPVNRGTWRDIKMHVKWSGSDSIGFIEIWIDGVRRTFYNGQQTLHIRTMYPGIGNYFKQGYYRDASVGGTGVVYHDNFRMSAPG